MADILDQMGITVNQSPPPDILDSMGIEPPTLKERNAASMGNAIDINAPKTPEEAAIVEDHNIDSDQMMTLAKMVHSPEKVKEFLDNPWTISQTFDSLAKGAGGSVVAAVAPYGGAAQMTTALSVKSLIDKQQKGEALTDAENEKVTQFLRDYTENALRSTKMGNGAKIFQVAAQIPAFAFEFGTAGKLIGAATKKGTEQVVKKTIMESLKAATVKSAVSGVSKGAVKTGAQTLLTIIPEKIYGQRRLSDSVAVTDKGEVLFTESKETPLKSALMAGMYAYSEVLSERAGGVLGEISGAVTKQAGKYVYPLTNKLKTPLVYTANNIPVGLRNSIYRAYTTTVNANAKASDVFTKIGWHGVLGELGEERLNMIMQAHIGVAGGDLKTFDDYVDALYPSVDEVMVEAGAILLGGTAISATNYLSFNIMKNKGVAPDVARETVDNMTATELDQFVEDNLEKPKSGYVIADLSGTLKKMEDTNYGEDFSVLNSEGETAGTIYTRTAENGDTMITNAAVIPEEARKGYFSKAYRNLANKAIDAGKNLTSDTMVSQIAEKIYRGLERDGYIVEQNPSAKRTPSGDLSTYNDEPVFRVTGRPPTSLVQDLADGLPTPSDPILEASATQMQKAQEAEPPPINDEESTANHVYRLWFNQLSPVQDLETMAKEVGAEIKAGESPKLLSRMYASVITRVQSQLQVATDYIDELGNRVVTGKAFKSIIDDFDNMFVVTEPNRKQREADFQDYLVATRYLEDLSKKKDVIVTEEQKAKSLADLARLSQKYGEEFEFFRTFAEELYGFQRRILENLVRSGQWSQAQFDAIVKENPNYIPFQRILEDESFGAITNSGLFTNANSKRIVKKIHGSEKEVKNVFESIIKNTARIMDYAERNRVAGSVAAMAEYLPEYVRETAAPVVKKGTAKIKVSFDKKLREKLTTTIQALGGTLERKKSVKVKGYKNVLGSYSPAEKAVRLKIGTTEGTMTHEVGHMIDFVFGLKEKLLNLPKVKAELQELAKQRLSADVELVQEGGDYRFRETIAEVGDQKYMDYILNNDEVIANFFDAYVNSPKLAKEIAPNAYKAFEKLVKETPEMAFIQDIKPSTERGEETIEQDVYGASPFTPPDTIVYFRDGKKEYYRVAKPIYEAMTQLSPTQLSLMEKIFMAPASILRMGATLTPEFMARSIVREGHTAMLLSGTKFSPVQWVQGLFGVIGNVAGHRSDLYKEWQASGGKFNFYMELNDTGLEKAYKQMLKPNGAFSDYLKNPLKVLEKVGLAVDEISRVGIYAAAKKQGYSDLEAAFISRDIYDYTRKGKYGKQVNRYVPFFNAGLQGADKLVRAFKQNPKAATFWSVATVTIPSMMLAGYYLYGAPDDERREYLEHPEAIRNLFWLYKKDGEWHKVPKPLTVGYIFGTIPEKLMIWMYEGDKPEGKALWQQILAGTMGAVSPVYDPSALIPTFAKIPLESITNYNFFYGRSVYPDWMDRLPPEMRVNKFTSETAKTIGEQLKMSPALIDNAIRGQLGGTGKYITDAGDYILNSIKEANGETVPVDPKSDTIILRAFAQQRPSGYRSNSAGNFFDRWNKLQQTHAAYNKKEGNERAEYLKDKTKEIQLYKPMKGYYEQMRGLQKEVDAIYEHKSMTAEQKVERINALEDKITEIARQGNKYYQRVLNE